MHITFCKITFDILSHGEVEYLRNIMFLLVQLVRLPDQSDAQLRRDLVVPVRGHHEDAVVLLPLLVLLHTHNGHNSGLSVYLERN